MNNENPQNNKARQNVCIFAGICYGAIWIQILVMDEKPFILCTVNHLCDEEDPWRLHSRLVELCKELPVAFRN